MKKYIQHLSSFLTLPTTFLSRKAPISLVVSIVLIVFSSNLMFSQLNSGTFEDMKQDFYAASGNSEKEFEIATSYLAKAKKENDAAQIVAGYELFVSHYSHTKKQFRILIVLYY